MSNFVTRIPYFKLGHVLHLKIKNIITIMYLTFWLILFERLYAIISSKKTLASLNIQQTT